MKVKTIAWSIKLDKGTLAGIHEADVNIKDLKDISAILTQISGRIRQDLTDEYLK